MLPRPSSSLRAAKLNFPPPDHPPPAKPSPAILAKLKGGVQGKEIASSPGEAGGSETSNKIQGKAAGSPGQAGGSRTSSKHVAPASKGDRGRKRTISGLSDKEGSEEWEEPGEEEEAQQQPKAKRQCTSPAVSRHGTKTSAFRGVTKRDGVSGGDRWEAQVNSNLRSVCLGHFTTEEEAARAYDSAMLYLHGK